MPTIHDAAKSLHDAENARLRRETAQQHTLITELRRNAYLRACLQCIEAGSAVNLQMIESVHGQRPRETRPTPIMLHDDAVRDYMDNRESHHDSSLELPQPIDMNPLLSRFRRSGYETRREVIPCLTQLGYYVIEYSAGPYQGREMWVYLENPPETELQDDYGFGTVKLWAPGTSHAEFQAKPLNELC